MESHSKFHGSSHHQPDIAWWSAVQISQPWLSCPAPAPKAKWLATDLAQLMDSAAEKNRGFPQGFLRRCGGFLAPYGKICEQKMDHSHFCRFFLRILTHPTRLDDVGYVPSTLGCGTVAGWNIHHFYHGFKPIQSSISSWVSHISPIFFNSFPIFQQFSYVFPMFSYIFLCFSNVCHLPRIFAPYFRHDLPSSQKPTAFLVSWRSRLPSLDDFHLLLQCLNPPWLRFHAQTWICHGTICV